MGMAKKWSKFILVFTKVNLHSITHSKIEKNAYTGHYVENIGQKWVILGQKGACIFKQRKLNIAKKIDFLKQTHRGYLKMQFEKNWRPITKQPWYILVQFLKKLVLRGDNHLFGMILIPEIDPWSRFPCFLSMKYME